MQWAIPIMLSMSALASNSVWAQGYSDDYKQCLNSSYGQASTIKKCVDKELKAQEKLLETYYKKYLKHSDTYRNNIEQQHQVWGNRVKQQCYSKVTSSYVELQQVKCVLEMTMQRAYYYETKQLVYR